MLSVKFKQILLTLIFIYLSVACSKQDTERFPIRLTLQNEDVPRAPGNQYLCIETNESWTLSSDSEWLTIDPLTGSGIKANIKVCYSANDTDCTRKATITAKTPTNETSIRLFQKGAYNPAGGVAPGPYLEYPAFKSQDHVQFIAHNHELDGKTFRNYAACYDSDARLSHWVAYPLNSSIIGGGSRSEQWGLDPLVAPELQPQIFNSYYGPYDRGHQCPSADRLKYEMNVETFYFTNMTPQLAKFNQGVWADLEQKVRNAAYASDTLYVVTGCHIGNSRTYTHDNAGNECVIPQGYYKALLRRKAGKYIDTGSFCAMAVYLEHNVNTAMPGRSQMLSIDQLEEIVGEDFFPNLTKWISQEMADKVEAEPVWLF